MRHSLVWLRLISALTLVLIGNPLVTRAQEAEPPAAGTPIVNTGDVYFIGDDLPIATTSTNATVNYTLEWIHYDRVSTAGETYSGSGAVTTVSGLGRVALLPTTMLTKKGVYFVSGDGIPRRRVLLVDPLPQITEPTTWPFGLITSEDKVNRGAATAEEMYRVGIRFFHFDYAISSINAVGASSDPNAGRLSPGFEAFINRAAELGVRPIFKLMSHYSQISGPTNLNGNFYNGLRRVQTYYAGKLKYWTIGNEVEGGGYSVFTPQQYADTIKNMATVLKGVDPGVHLIAGEFYYAGNGHLDLLVQPAYRNAWDILSGHRVVGMGQGTDPVSAYVANLEGLNKPFWDTEANGTMYGGPSEWELYQQSRFPTASDSDFHSGIAKHIARTFCLEAQSGSAWVPAYFNPATPCLGAKLFIAMHYDANWETQWALRRHWISDTQQPSEQNAKVANFRTVTDMLYGTSALTRIPNTEVANPNAPGTNYTGADGYVYRYGGEYMLILWQNTGDAANDRELTLTTNPSDQIVLFDSFGNAFPLQNNGGTVKVWVRPEVVYVRGFSQLPGFARETSGNDNPYFTSTPLTQAVTGQRYVYAATAYDSDPPTSGDDSLPRITYSLITAPSGMAITNGVIQWTPSATGIFNVTVRASSQHGSAKTVDQSFAVNVASGNLAPFIHSQPMTVFGATGAVWRYNVNARDPNGTPATYALTQAPAGMTIDATSGFIQWTPAQTGNFPVTVSASDGAASATQTFTVRVGAGTIPVTGPPTMTASPSGAMQGGAITFTLTLFGNGQSTSMTDTLPGELTHQASATTCPGAAPSYNGSSHSVSYSGTIPGGQACTVSIMTTVNTASRMAVTNSAVIDNGAPVTVQATVLLNPTRVFLPIVNR
jgi:hypothetical protein